MTEPSFPWDAAGAARDWQARRRETPAPRPIRLDEYLAFLEALPRPLTELRKVKAFSEPFSLSDPPDG